MKPVSLLCPVARQILCLFLCLLPTIKMHSQELPSLPRDPEITVGSFPNGAPYYIVKNKSPRGFADFALVRKGSGTAEGLREALASLPHFSGRKPYEFLAENGIGPGPGGFITVRDGADVLNFRNVPIYRQEVQDSTLLLLFDVMAMSGKPQAVIISGDVDIAKIRERAELFSMMVSQLEKDPQTVDNVWTPRDNPRHVFRQNFSDNVAGIHVIYSSRRGDRGTLGTVLPLVTRMYSTQMSIILDARIRDAFREAGIPLADVRFRYKDSSEDSEDERFQLSVFVPSGSVDASAALLGGVLGEFDRNGASIAEFKAAKGRIAAERNAGAVSADNARNVRRCLSAYMYGTDLASDRAVEDFYLRRNLPDDRELELFNGFASALLDPGRNLAVRCEHPSERFDSGAVLAGFTRGWEKGAAVAQTARPATLASPSAKVKIKSESKDPVTGGALWTFSNDMKVIFKKTGPKGGFQYSVILNGGIPTVPDISAGESAFLSDMLALSDIGGVSGREFFGQLTSEGISMDIGTTMATLNISGAAPVDRLETLVGALLTLSSDRKVNGDAFRYYRECEVLREDMRALSPRDARAVMDSLICPNYLYSGRKEASLLRDGLPQKAERYFERQFAKMNDGVIVILGDFEADALKKDLQKLLGDFRTRKVNTPRPNVDFPMIAGKVSRVDEAVSGTIGPEEFGVNMEFSAFVPYNLSNRMSFHVALDILRKELAAAFLAKGCSVSVDGEYETFPKERVRVYVSCRPCRESGVPAGVEVADQLGAVAQLRRFVEGMSSISPDPVDLKAAKAKLSAELDAEFSDNGRLLELVAVRYGEGKDLVTGAKAAVESVTADSVRKMLGLLASGAQVEYVIL